MFKVTWFLILVFHVTDIFALCGYESCPALSEDKINVHIIPHSHDDVGWVKTVDQYFYGYGGGSGVKHIITSVVDALKQNPERRFTQVETAYFWKWWKEASESMRRDYRTLVDNGQIEIANGGWVMNDEACSNYQSIIDQFTWGLRTINETLGECGRPRIGWQIDPFGHSSEQASIFAQLGFDGIFFVRLDYRDKDRRKGTNTLDFVWKSNTNTEAFPEIFTHIFPNHYSSPSGFCWDVNCNGRNSPVIADPDSFDYNVPHKIDEFKEAAENYLQFTVTDNIIIPMGDDFQFEGAEMYFSNLDLIIETFNKNQSKFNVIYSTPSCYVRAVNLGNPKLSVKNGDFFPYADGSHSYWSGYYTSRPNSKRFERTSHSILQAAKQLTAIYKIVNGSDYDENLRKLREISGVMQHHDAISGTEKQAVTYDYVKQILRGVSNAEKPMGLIFGNLLSKDSTKDIDLKLSGCLLANITICEISSNSDNFIVAVYNPLAKNVTHYVRLPVSNASYVITGPNGVEKYDLVKPISDFAFVKYDEKPSQTELLFSARDIPPFGINLYYVAKSKANSSDTTKNISKDGKLLFGTDAVNFELDETTKRLKSVTMNNITVNITQEFHYYNSENGTNNGVPSGAYLFRPVAKTTTSTKVTDEPATVEYSMKGNVVHEVHLKITDWIKQIIRVYTEESLGYIEFDWLVGPLEVDVKNHIGKEVIIKFNVENLDNNGTFYTDSNGREMLKRIRNKRDGYPYDATVEPISSNYYPVTSKIAMRDETKKIEVAVLNDRSQGGGSINDGEIELMIHRRTLIDDHLGVGEPLNEIEFDQGLRVRGQHFLVIGSTDHNTAARSIEAQERDLAEKKLLSPWVLVGNAISEELSLDNVKKNLNFQFRFVNSKVPENVNILTLEPWQNGSYLIRVEHTIGKNEDATLSDTATLNLNEVFFPYNITDITETLLDGNRLLKDFKKEFQWDTDTYTFNETLNVPKAAEDAGKVEVEPMQIRTFIIKIS